MPAWLRKHLENGPEVPNPQMALCVDAQEPLGPFGFLVEHVEALVLPEQRGAVAS